MKNISIIVPIHNRLSLTQAGIKSLYNSLTNYKKAKAINCTVDIVVIDDGSTDGSSEWISKNYPLIHLLKGDGNLWWSGSINMGAKYAVKKLKSDYVILWNDDTLCDINYFTELDNLLSRHTFVDDSIIASKVFWLNEGKTLFNYGCYYSYKTGKKTVIGLDKPDSKEFNKILPIDWSGGMGTIIPAKILEKIEYFDDINFPQYHADIDFFLRAHRAGYKAFAVPTLIIYNNKESTGISKTRSLKDLKNMLFSNRSNYNIKQNFIFNQRHSNTLVSWVTFSLKYFSIFSRSVHTIVWS